MRGTAKDPIHTDNGNDESRLMCGLVDNFCHLMQASVIVTSISNSTGVGKSKDERGFAYRLKAIA